MINGPIGPIFVVGMPRSGTSVLSSTLSRHSMISIAPETHFFDVWMKKYGHREPRMALGDFRQAFLNNENFSQMNFPWDQVEARLTAEGPLTWRAIFQAILSVHAEINGKVIPGEKTPGHFRYCDVIYKWFPTSRIILVVRDPRAISASLDKVPWGHSVRFIHASEWRAAIHLIHRYSQDPRFCWVRYESFVTSPESACRAMCDTIGIEFEPSMLDASSRPREAHKDGDWLQTHWEAASAPINLDSVEKWRKQLSPYEVHVIEHLLREEMLRMGYGVETDGLPLSFRVRLLGDRIKLHYHRLIRFCKSPMETIGRVTDRSGSWQ